MKFLFYLTLFFTILSGFFATLFKHVSPEEIKELSANIFDAGFYVALVNPDVKFVRVQEGVRKEQIIEEVKDTLSWSDNDVVAFAGFDELRDSKFEGKFFPGSYVIPKDTTGVELKQMMLERFNTRMLEEGVETDIRKNNFDTDTILTIASIIQREAGSKSDMYLVSGIIWNRIFSNMSLQMDATLQYAKGNEENGWWPKVVPDDKYIESPYNTYQNKGLPPSPIANPGFAAIHAALHPKETECIFYFHKNRKNYCSKTYQEHKRKIDLYLK